MIRHLIPGTLQGVLVGAVAVVTMRMGVAVERRAAARRRAALRRHIGRITVRPGRAVTTVPHFSPRTWWS